MEPNSVLFTTEELEQWRKNLAVANRNNIFCHCRNCEAEWVDSSEDNLCPECGSRNIEHISCWQFPDD
ncbi:MULTISPECIES: hypothetical protein [Planktothricoides]|uniref:Uncharacterized protein n=2 Tax=Planktothricoides raciborskii TaxID=132608 RepID=A0AAU8JIQ9_9CYAN|nr:MULTISPECIES: hypothetical protein [Planktothricoides]KOR34161.1 HAD family hydrolase [Planktothricoides sp. SR001]MBD2547336.1 hypothetical protein [Planktothricoides raciborskii FACHB-1370]MBD2585192.1 hypothetical protein [Planktothricoides raciborskii FACHB-1261]